MSNSEQISETPRVLHVTEAMAGGILTVVSSFAARQFEEGAIVSVYYLSRPDSPEEDQVRRRFPREAKVKRFDSQVGPIVGRIRLAFVLWRSMVLREFSAIHLHSSRAGLVGRVLYLLSGRRTPVYYSPHGFAFLRSDTSNMTRFLTRVVERVLAKTAGGLILTCISEQNIAQSKLKASSTFVVDTGVDFRSEYLGVPRIQRESNSNEKITIACVARVVYQKAPWRFAAIANELEGYANFKWIGSGRSEDEDSWLDGVDITGWLSPEDLERTMQSVDLLVFPSLWEGMPLSLMQAQAHGIPAIVSNIVGNRDGVLNGETGFICDSHEEMVARIMQLISDEDLRRRMSISATRWATEKLSDRNLGRQSLAIYSQGSSDD